MAQYNRNSQKEYVPPTLEEARLMLTYIDSTNRETWYKMAAALKSEFREQGKALYFEWSKSADNYKASDCDSQWRGADITKNNIGFLVNRAKENGFVRKNVQPMSAEQIAERERRNARELAKAEKERQAAHKEAARIGEWLWNKKAVAANPNHPYLQKKGITDPVVLSSIKQVDDKLIVPVKKSGKIVGVQWIMPDGRKPFNKGIDIKGGAIVIGNRNDMFNGFYVAEGFATAASIVAATGKPCVVSFGSENLEEVTSNLKGFVTKNNIPVAFCADINDGSVQNPNVGIRHAQAAAEILGKHAKVITPDFTEIETTLWQAQNDGNKPTDFNDLQQIGGVERVASVLSGSLTAVVNPENKLLINVYGSPATGKSYTAEHLAAALRDAGIACELVTEYATELIHQGRTDELKDQVVVTGEQLRREQAALNHANIVITDSPTALGIIYAPEHQKAALHDIAAQSDKIPHINILLRHDYESLATFSINGRIHDKEQSLAIQEQLIEMLKGKERIHHQRATPFEELINHIGTNQEWQRFAEHHNINLPRFDIAMDGTVLGRQPETFSGSLNVAENDTLTAEKTAESITMNDLKPIQARSYDNDPIRKAIQDIVIDDIKANFTLYQQEYRQHPESFDGRYICSDLFKETIPFYNTDRETRSLFNGLVHNSAAVLADKQFYDALSEIRQENDSKGKVAVFLTGSPGAGKTSSVQQGMVDEPNTALIYEGQLIRPESAIDKIQAALDSGLKVKILAVQNTPETALDNTIKRFEKLGRGSSIEVMAQIMGKTADGLDKLHQHFGDRIELEIHERHENDPLPPQYGWEHLDILRKYGDYEKTRQYLGQVLEQSRETGTYSENALHQANGRVGRVEQKHKLSLTSALLAYETRPRVLGDSRKQSLLSALETLTPSKQNSEISTNPEKPRPPQGGFSLPVENQSDENRQPENSNSKENQMATQQDNEWRELLKNNKNLPTETLSEIVEKTNDPDILRTVFFRTFEESNNISQVAFDKWVKTGDPEALSMQEDMEHREREIWLDEQIDEMYWKADKYDKLVKAQENPDKQMLMQMLNNKSVSFRQMAAASDLADDEVLQKAFQDTDESVRLAAVRNPNASSEFLQDAFNDALPTEKEAILNHPNANEELFKEVLIYSNDDSVINIAKERLQNEYAWDDERFAALEQKKSELTAAPPLEKQEWQPDTFTPDTWQPENGLEQNKHLDGETAQKVDETATQTVDNNEKEVSGSPEQASKPQIAQNFAERQAEINRQKAELQNKLDELQNQQEAVNNLQVQLTQEQLDEIDKKFEEIYKQQAELDRQIDELQIERRQVLGQADISENLNEENSIYFGESDEIITAEEINKPQAVFATPKEKANAVFEELKTHYQDYGEYDSLDSVMYLPNGKNAEMLHFDPTQERIVLSAVNPQTKGREEVADTHFSNLDPHYIALAVDKDYQQYQQTIAQNQGKFPDNEQKKTIDKAGDSVEETIRTAKSKTAKLTPPNAPPETISERYNAVERKFLDTKTNLRLTHRVDYVDSENGKTVLFTDKGSKLTTAKNDPQTAADMVEVAKAKGWTTLKLSGNKEFKRQAWLAAESQGIKTKGYKPSPQDLAMLEKMREKRSLNSVEQSKKQEKAPDRQPEHTPQAEKQADKAVQKDFSGSPKQESTPETAIQGGILLEHGAARFQFDKDKPMSYYAMLQMPNGEKQVLWGKEIEKTLQEHNVQIGDRISLQKNGYENVRVQEPIKDKDGKTVLDENGNPKTEEVMRKRNHWDLAILDKAQEVPKEQEVKHDLMGQPDSHLKESIDSQFRAEQYRDWAYSEAGRLDKQAASNNAVSEVYNQTDEMRSFANQGVTMARGAVPRKTGNRPTAKKAADSKSQNLSTAKALYQKRFTALPKSEQQKVLYAERVAAAMLVFVKDPQHKQEAMENWYRNTANGMDIQNGKSGFADINTNQRPSIEYHSPQQQEEEYEIDR